MTSTTPEHAAHAGTIEAQIIVIMDGKVVVQDTVTVEKGCYSLDVTMTPKECCKPAAEEAPALPAIGAPLTRGDAVAFA